MSSVNPHPPQRGRLNFRNLTEEDDTTTIKEIKALKLSLFKICVVVPLLSILSGLIFLLWLYWDPKLRAKFFYEETTLNLATYVSVQGLSKPLLYSINDPNVDG